jgi:uncharacterized membrane protein YgdD (TMEM256/DUF423 family)
MDKRRTIYKLQDLSGSLLLALTNLLVGSGLLFGLKVFPNFVKNKIQLCLMQLFDVNISPNMDILNEQIIRSVDLFHVTALEIILTSIVSLVCILFLIRSNGKVLIRKIISWIISLGVFLMTLFSIMVSVRFMSCADLLVAHKGLGFINVIGSLLFIAGLILLFFKSFKDLTDPVSVS